MEASLGQPNRALVVTGGDEWSGPLPEIGAHVGLVIAADSGVELALQLGLPVNVVIGDLDSALPASLEEAERLGASIERHPAEKDATDLELALDRAAAAGVRHITVIGGNGGRLSHLLGIGGLLASSRYADIEIVWRLPHASVYVANRQRPTSIDGTHGDLVSLVPIGGPVAGITTTGLKWALHDERLTSDATRGISNVMVADRIEISVADGTLLAIHERATE